MLIPVQAGSAIMLAVAAREERREANPGLCIVDTGSSSAHPDLIKRLPHDEANYLSQRWSASSNNNRSEGYGEEASIWRTSA